MEKKINLLSPKIWIWETFLSETFLRLCFPIIGDYSSCVAISTKRDHKWNFHRLVLLYISTYVYIIKAFERLTKTTKGLLCLWLDCKQQNNQWWFWGAFKCHLFPILSVFQTNHQFQDSFYCESLSFQIEKPMQFSRITNFALRLEDIAVERVEKGFVFVLTLFQFLSATAVV